MTCIVSPTHTHMIKMKAKGQVGMFTKQFGGKYVSIGYQVRDTVK